MQKVERSSYDQLKVLSFHFRQQQTIPVIHPTTTQDQRVNQTEVVIRIRDGTKLIQEIGGIG